MWYGLLAAVILLVIGVDQCSKWLIVRGLYDGQVTVIPHVLRFTYVENDGMAFGLLADHRWVFLTLSIIGISALGFYLFRYVKKTLPGVALALIVGGGIGNMIDRVRLSYVIDFIDFYFIPVWYWVFNVADAAVCVGGALFIFSLLRDIIREEKVKKKAVTSGQGDENSTDVPPDDGHGGEPHGDA